MESPSRILEALERTHPAVGARTSEQLTRRQVIFEAARFPTLLYRTCRECVGGHLTPTPEEALSQSDTTCPSCGGSGVAPTEEAVEALGSALSLDDEACRDDNGDAMLRSALMALRTIGDEG